MDVLDDGLLQFWRVLNENSVQYIMIGGFATRFHGFSRATEDIDLWLADTLENRQRLRKAFKELDYGDFEEFETMQFVPGFSSITIAGGIELDIMTSMKGLEQYSFEDCLDRASVADLEGIKVPFLHINHLIENKKKLNRPKDQVDVIELEKIRKLREDN